MLISVRVHTRASRAKVAWKDEGLEVWVTAPPVAGAANQAVLQAVAGELGVPISAVRLRSGARGRTKLVEVARATRRGAGGGSVAPRRPSIISRRRP
ncbi:DUF167 domain-containing protein [bacterium]|nr:MAG: DUF167 domain-containing protein [bacterium]